MAIDVYIEASSKRAFAAAFDWPGWCRSGKDESSALAALAGAAPRYAAVAAEAGVRFPTRADQFEVVERVAGGASTDFGVPGAIPTHDGAPTSATEAERLARLVSASWKVFDRVVAGAPAELRRGPRGGGRDRDKIVAHVVGAEVMYAQKLGLRFKEPDPTDSAALAAIRAAILDALRRASDGGSLVEKGWPPRYAARRIAWHALDHAWEIEERSQPQ